MESLAKVGGQEAVEALRSALRDPSPSVRYEVLTSLAEIGEDSARASLLRALPDPDELVRDKGAELLATLTRNRQRSISSAPREGALHGRLHRRAELSACLAGC